MPDDYLATADVWTVLDLIVVEFMSDPRSVQCFDLRLVRRAIALRQARRRDAVPRILAEASLYAAVSAASHALRTLQCGPELAEAMADTLDAALAATLAHPSS